MVLGHASCVFLWVTLAGNPLTTTRWPASTPAARTRRQARHRHPRLPKPHRARGITPRLSRPRSAVTWMFNDLAAVIKGGRKYAVSVTVYAEPVAASSARKQRQLRVVDPGLFDVARDL